MTSPDIKMSIGFTGTRAGMSDMQKQALFDKLLQLHQLFTWFHHGDCIGADSEAQGIARSLGYNIALHPPSNSAARANCNADYVYAEAPYLERNHGIVNQSVFLIAAPFTMKEQLRSGTWATVRYARKLDKYVHILAR